MSNADSLVRLVQRAREAALGAYAPYSRFSVGCAVESVDGEVAVGANMENACYRLGVCAELAALTAAQQAFGLAKVARIAVAGGHVGSGGTLTGSLVVTSCGGCRQAILEAAEVAGVDVEVISANGDGTERRVDPISALIPHGFGPANLKDSPDRDPSGRRASEGAAQEEAQHRTTGTLSNEDCRSE